MGGPLRGDSRHAVHAMAGLRDTGACGLYGTSGWQPAWLPLFRRTARVYIALDRDAIDRAIALARTFGIRGRVLIPRGTLGRRAISMIGYESGASAMPPCSSRCSNGPSQQVQPLGPSRSNGYHRTWRPGIWRTMQVCAISCARSAIKDL